MATPATTFVGWTTRLNTDGGPAVTVNAVLVAAGSAPLDAVSCLLPGRLTLSAGNDAIPFTSLTTAAPPFSAPVPTSASDTDVPETGFVNASRTSTWTAGAMLPPATTLPGCTANDRFAAAAAV